MVFRTAVFQYMAYCCLLVSLLTSTADAAPLTVEQVQQALDIAELAARNQLVELSLKAVERALQSGPPSVSTRTPLPSVQSQGARIDISQPAPISPVHIVRTRIPHAIRQLSEFWAQHGEPQRVYETLQSVVLPPNRPNEIFLYASESDAADDGQRAYCVGHDLIRSAAAVQQVPELVDAIQARGLDHSADATVLLLLCSLEINEATGVSQYSERLGKIMTAGSSPDSVRLAANAGLRVRHQTSDTKAVADILYAAAKTSLTISRYDSETSSHPTAIAMEGVRSCFAAGREDDAIELLKLCLPDADQRTDRDQSSGEAGQIRELVASELYARGLVQTARDILGATEAMEFESRYLNPLLLNPNGKELKPRIASDSAPTRARILPMTDTVSMADRAGQIWICALDTESNQSKILFTLPDFQNVSYPVVSPDGSQLAFAATFPGEVVTSDSRIYIASLSGTEIRELGRGTLPSWSPAGRRLVCSRYSPDRGVWLVRVSNGSFQLLDEKGWSGKWSPDGSKIAYIRAAGSATDFVVADLVEDTNSRIASGRRTSTAQSSWNFCWAPDSSCLMVEASPHAERGSYGRTSLDVSDDNHNPNLHHDADYFNADFVQWPQRSLILLAPKLKKYNAERLYHLEADGANLTELPGQFDNRRNSGMSWMPDGRTLIYLSRQERR